MIDWTQPVETVDGQPVRVVTLYDTGAAVITGLPADPNVGRHAGEHVRWGYNPDGTIGNPFLPNLRNVATQSTNRRHPADDRREVAPSASRRKGGAE